MMIIAYSQYLHTQQSTLTSTISIAHCSRHIETSTIDIIALTLYYHPHSYTIALILLSLIKYISKILEI
jgi:hypothetical protein